MNPNKNDDMRRYADMMDRKRRRHDEPGDGMPRVDAESPEQAAEEPKKPLSDEEHARAALRKFTEVETDPDRVDVSLRSILGGDILAGEWFRRQFFFILMLVAFIIVYVSNRYASQQELLEIDALQKQRIDEQYRALTRSSELMELTRRSSVENYLRTTNDSTLQTATVPPYTLDVDEN